MTDNARTPREDWAMAERTAESPTYLGDGVSASFDGYQIWLRTPREDGVHEIALEPGVYRALCDYIDKRFGFA